MILKFGNFLKHRVCAPGCYRNIVMSECRNFKSQPNTNLNPNPNLNPIPTENDTPYRNPNRECDKITQLRSTFTLV